MKEIIIDSNVLFSLMNPNSISSYLFFSVSAVFIAPEFIKQEFQEHKEECLEKSNLSEEQFQMRLDEIEQSVTFFPVSEYKDCLEEASNLISDIDDIDILALALKRNAEIWSNDIHLKEQAIIPVLTTQGLLELFIKREI